MRSNKKTIKLCKESFEWWTQWLGLRWWNIDVAYYTDKKSIKKEFGKRVAMRCYADWRYMNATITVNVPVVRKEDDIDSIVLHELCHILINEMRAEGIDHEERVVTTLTKAFRWVRDQNLTG